jgi:hypothetical protein
LTRHLPFSFDDATKANLLSMLRCTLIFNHHYGHTQLNPPQLAALVLGECPTRLVPLCGASWKNNLGAQAEVAASAMTFSSSACPTAGAFKTASVGRGCGFLSSPPPSPNTPPPPFPENVVSIPPRGCVQTSSIWCSPSFFYPLLLLFHLVLSFLPSFGIAIN